jgi:histidinol-phosphate/aromatic aminotransferase/cobyric acid decarboxylase-like protein
MRSYQLPEWTRVSVGTMVQNEKFVRVLKDWLGGRVA